VSRRPLRIAARAEAVTLALLLLDVATVHAPQVSALLGPVHGCAYLFVIAATVREPAADRTAKALTLLPGVGGLLALRRLTARPAERGPAASPAGRLHSPAASLTTPRPNREELL
jgi:hypothetical protein